MDLRVAVVGAAAEPQQLLLLSHLLLHLLLLLLLMLLAVLLLRRKAPLDDASCVPPLSHAGAVRDGVDRGVGARAEHQQLRQHSLVVVAVDVAASSRGDSDSATAFAAVLVGLLLVFRIHTQLRFRLCRLHTHVLLLRRRRHHHYRPPRRARAR